jgi:hypothetical protein
MPLTVDCYTTTAAAASTATAANTTPTTITATATAIANRSFHHNAPRGTVFLLTCIIYLIILLLLKLI